MHLNILAPNPLRPLIGGSCLHIYRKWLFDLNWSSIYFLWSQPKLAELLYSRKRTDPRVTHLSRDQRVTPCTSFLSGRFLVAEHPSNEVYIKPTSAELDNLTECHTSKLLISLNCYLIQSQCTDKALSPKTPGKLLRNLYISSSHSVLIKHVFLKRRINCWSTLLSQLVTVYR